MNPSNSLKEIILKLEVIITKIIEEKCMNQHILIKRMFVMLHLNVKTLYKFYTGHFSNLFCS